MEDITLDNHRGDYAYMTLLEGEDAVDMRIGDGVNSLEEAFEYGVSAQ